MDGYSTPHWQDINRRTLTNATINDSLTIETESEPRTVTEVETIGDGVPERHLDLRYGGMGLVLDFGFKRSDESIRWEMTTGRGKRKEVAVLGDDRAQDTGKLRWARWEKWAVWGDFSVMIRNALASMTSWV